MDGDFEEFHLTNDIMKEIPMSIGHSSPRPTAPSKKPSSLICSPNYTIDWRQLIHGFSDTTYISSENSSDSTSDTCSSISSCSTCSPMPAILKQDVKREVFKNYRITSVSMLDSAADTECFPSTESSVCPSPVPGDDQTESFIPTSPTAQTKSVTESPKPQSEFVAPTNSTDHTDSVTSAYLVAQSKLVTQTNMIAASESISRPRPVNVQSQIAQSQTAFSDEENESESVCRPNTIAESESIRRARPVNIQSQIAQSQTAFSDEENENDLDKTLEYEQEISPETEGQRPTEKVNQEISLDQSGEKPMDMGSPNSEPSIHEEPHDKSASVKASVSLSGPPSRTSVCESAISYRNPLVPVGSSSREESPFVRPLSGNEIQPVQNELEKGNQGTAQTLSKEIEVKKEPGATSKIPPVLQDEVICLDSSSSSSASPPKSTNADSGLKPQSTTLPAKMPVIEGPDKSAVPRENDIETTESIEAPESLPSQIDIVVPRDPSKPTSYTCHPSGHAPQSGNDFQDSTEPQQEPVAASHTETGPALSARSNTPVPSSPPPRAPTPVPSGLDANTGCVKTEANPILPQSSSPPLPVYLDLTRDDNSDSLDSSGIKITKVDAAQVSNMKVTQWLNQMPEDPAVPEDDPPSHQMNESTEVFRGVDTTVSAFSPSTAKRQLPTATVTPMNYQNTQSSAHLSDGNAVTKSAPPQNAGPSGTSDNPCREPPSAKRPVLDSHASQVSGISNIVNVAPARGTANQPLNQLPVTTRDLAIAQPHSGCPPSVSTPRPPPPYPLFLPPGRNTTSSHIPSQGQPQSQGTGNSVNTSQPSYQHINPNSSTYGLVGQPSHVPRCQAPAMPNLDNMNQFYQSVPYQPRYSGNLPYPHPNVFPRFDFGADPAWQPPPNPMQSNPAQHNSMVSNQTRVNALPNNGIPRMTPPAAPQQRVPYALGPNNTTSIAQPQRSNLQYSQPRGSNIPTYGHMQPHQAVHQFGQLPPFRGAYGQPPHQGSTPSAPGHSAELPCAVRSAFGQPPQFGRSLSPYGQPFPPTQGQPPRQASAQSSMYSNPLQSTTTHSATSGQPPHQRSAVSPMLRDQQQSPAPQPSYTDSKSQLQAYMQSNPMHNSATQGVPSLANQADTSLPPRKRKIFKDVIVLDDS